MFVSIAAFVLITAVSVWFHLRGSRRPRKARAAGPACPRCRTPIPDRAATCPGCDVPLQALELVAAPIAAEPDPDAAAAPVALHAMVRADVCVGCGACVPVCPEPGAIRLEHKLAIVDTGRCKGHGECVAACPVGGILLTSGDAVQRIETPDLDVHFQSNVPGLYVVGELGGRGLIKNAVNEGKLAIEHVAKQIRGSSLFARRSADVFDVAVVGSGPAGLSAGLEALRAGLRYVVLEQGDLSDTIRRYPRHKLLLAEPVRMPLYGDLWVADASKESLLQVWDTMIRRTGLQIRTGQRVEDVAWSGDRFTLRTADREWQAHHVVLALGRRGTPRRLEVPGEDLPKVFYDIVEMEAFAGARVLVVGGGDSAVESAVGLANQQGTTVTFSYRGAQLSRVKPRNVEKLDAEIARGRVRACFGSQVREIRDDAVVLDTGQGEEALPNDYVIVRIGGVAPYGFLQRIGVRIVTRELAIAPAASAAAGA